MEKSFKTLIQESKSVLILLPTRPYFDQVAAGLSLYLTLRDHVQVQISSSSQMIVEFNRLVGVNKITQELGNKSLVIRFSDYKANDIERVSYDIEDGQFRLTVIPKNNINPPAKEQVVFSYSGISADIAVLIGGANESHFPALALKDLTSSKLIHIGIRDISLPSNKSYISFAQPASSVSEVAYSLIKESGYSIDEDIATNLLMGIEEGSEKFTSGNVNAETFQIVSELMKAGGKRQTLVASISPFPPGSIPGSTSMGQTSVPADNIMQQAQRNTQEPENDQVKRVEEPPKEWLQQPKVYKGTSVS